MNKWIDTDHVKKYLNRADRIPHRKEGERVLLEHLPDRLLDVQTQVEWLRAIGFEDVDCYWKWLELALLIGYRPR